MASRAGIDKIRFVHGLNDIAKDFVAGYMAVNFIDYPELFNVEMDKGVIFYAVIHRHLKERDEMIPGVMVGNVIYVCLSEKFLLFEAFVIVFYDVNRTVFINSHVTEDPEFFAA